MVLYYGGVLQITVKEMSKVVIIKNLLKLWKPIIYIIRNNEIFSGLWYNMGKILIYRGEYRMSFLDIVKKRYSVRKYKDKPVKKEKILQVLEAARNAPSAVNYQPWHFIVLTDEELKNKIAEAYPRDWFKKAPVIIVACGDHSVSWKRQDSKDHCDIDLGIAVEHIALAAADIGLGTCWACAFDAEKCHEIMELPDNLEVVALLPMGYPDAETIPAKKRKSIDEIVSWEHY